jgi:hypothetical protein
MQGKIKLQGLFIQKSMPSLVLCVVLVVGEACNLSIKTLPAQLLRANPCVEKSIAGFCANRCTRKDIAPAAFVQCGQPFLVRFLLWLCSALQQNSNGSVAGVW